jgi:NDP-sugar pyrophosphorylase family protein
MQAVVLVGGRGTRLFPLTQTTPKPLIPLANRPLVEHIVCWLEQAGIEEVLLLTQFRANAFDRWLQRWQGIPVRAIEEPVPLGTAGAVANVARFLHGTTAVINGDNVTNIDLQAMERAHRDTGAVATIAVDRVEDVTGRGVVVTGTDGRVSQFQEKPAAAAALSKTVNTGTYLIEPDALTGVVPGQPAMWETDVFPMLIAGGAPVYAFEMPHLWLDAGTPAGYFAAQQAILEGVISAPRGSQTDGIWVEAEVDRDDEGTYQPPIAVGSGASFAAGTAVVGPVSIGSGCRVLAGARIEHSAIWDGCTIGRNAIVRRSIIGYNCLIADDARVEAALLGDGVIVRSGAHVVAGSRLEPQSVVEQD